jgi:K+-sensing histidine kinase KdpD
VKKKVITQIQSVRIIVHQLLDVEQSSLNDEQSEDVNHILSALDLMEQLALVLDTMQKTDGERMQLFHDLTSPINGIIGYLYILEQGYNAPLTKSQLQLVKSIEAKIHQLYQYISNQLLSPQADS